MGIQVEVDWSPLYELAVSWTVFYDAKLSKMADLKRAWVEQVRQAVPAEARWKGAYERHDYGIVPLLIWQSPERDSPEAFARWLGSRTESDLFGLISPHYRRFPFEQTAELLTYRDRLADLMLFWGEHYPRLMNPALLPGLAKSAETTRHLAATLPPEQVVELATGGVRLELPKRVDRVLLVPQWHGRPINLYHHFSRLAIYMYPTEAVPPNPGDPSPSLLRMVHAVSDPSRLRMLRMLADGPLSLTEIQKATGLTKSTVHHHLVALRSAGVVLVHDRMEKNLSYSLRPSAIDLLHAELSHYLKGESR